MLIELTQEEMQSMLLMVESAEYYFADDKEKELLFKEKLQFNLKNYEND